jgi:hypothetical protein
MLNAHQIVRLQGYEFFRIDPAAFGSVVDADAQNGEASLFALPAGSLVAQVRFSARDMAQFGVKVHTAMLDVGTYRIVLRMNGREMAGELAVNRADDELAKQVQQDLLKHGTQILFFGYCDSTLYPYREDTNAWFDKPNARQRIDELVSQRKIDEAQREILTKFIDDGYIIVKKAIPDELLDAVNEELDHVIATKYYRYEYGSSNRIEGMHKIYPNTQRLWLSESWRKYVDLIFQARSLPCQTLAFIFGSQQDAHQDTIHLTPYPKGYMCGTWIALQDVVEGSGELAYYPGSHREPVLRSSDISCGKVVNDDYGAFALAIKPEHEKHSIGYEKERFQPRKGDILIWHENLLHEGTHRVLQSVERRSVVIHSFALNSLVYYDAIGIPGYVANI